MNREQEDVQAAKVRVRQAVTARLATMTPERRRDAGIALVRQLAGLSVLREARTVMLFLSLPTEIDTWPTFQWLWREGKRTVVPRLGDAGPASARVPLSERPMDPVLLAPADVASPAAHPALRPGSLGILEPFDAPAVPVEDLDVILLPCAAVDRRGNRLGKGGGFFDRFLCRPEVRAVSIVLAFQEQVLDEVPVTGDDFPVLRVVTDQEMWGFE